MSRRTRIMLAVLALPLALCIGAGVWLAAREQEHTARLQRQQEARARWDRRAFGDYRVVAADGDCTYDVLVRSGKVQGTFRDSCNLRARTIESLFALIADDGNITDQCGLHGCLCEIVTTMTVEYDQTLGYPRMLTISATQRPNWRHPDAWRQLLATQQAPRCDGSSRRTISVLYVAAANPP